MRNQFEAMLHLIPRLIHPREVCLKRGSAARLRYLDARRAALVCGSQSLRAAGHLDKLANFLKAAKAEVAVLDGVAGEPTESAARQLAARLAEFKPDWIIAVGGGAVLDTAKLAWALHEQPALTLERMLTPFAVQGLRSRARFVAVPTVAGSGSEVSSAAVVTDPETGWKQPVLSGDFIPDIVILDPALTLQVPMATTVVGGLDALTHAVEAFCSTLSNPLAESLALAAGVALREHLPRALAEPQNFDARERLLIAAYQAGLAQNLVSVGAVHAISHVISTPLQLAHGLCNALLFGPVLRFNSATSSRPGEFAALAGFGGLGDLCQWVQTQLGTVQLPPRLNLPDGFPLNAAAARAEKDICLRTNPRKAAAAELAELIHAAATS